MPRGATFTVYRTWVDGNTLTASDLNSSLAQYITNGDPSGIGSYFVSLAEMRVTADPVLGVPGSLLVWMHYMHYKLIEIGKARGITLTNWDDDIPGVYAASTGTNTITATFDPPLTAHTTGMPLLIKAGGTTTGATTFNPNGIGDKNVKVGSAALTEGQITINKGYWLMYDGTQYQLLNPDAVASSDTITNLAAASTDITAAQCTGRTTITNAGRGALSSTAVLPAGAANYIIHFNHVDSGDLVIDPNGTEALYVDGVSLGAGIALTSAKKGAKYTCIWNSSGGWWEVNYYNTKVTAQTVLSADVSLNNTNFTAVSGMTITIVCGISGKVKVEAFACCFVANSVADYGWNLGVYRTAVGTEDNKFGVTESSVNNGYKHNGGVAEYAGLTPGTSYTFGVMWKANNANGTVYCNATGESSKMRIRGETW